MSLTKEAKNFQAQVLSADDLYAQVKAILAESSTSLPATSRRPDVRLIVNNASGTDVTFANPGNHAGGKDEVIPGTGKNTAAMVMLKGDTLAEQRLAAKIMFDLFDLGTSGLSEAFVTALKSGKLSTAVSEAYGPAPFAGQASKLVDVSWTAADGQTTVTTAETGVNAALGARAATTETVFAIKTSSAVKGTKTSAELPEDGVILVAVSEDWQTKEISTRPIVPSVAKGFYGNSYNQIPVVTVEDGKVTDVNLNNGTKLKAVALTVK